MCETHFCCTSGAAAHPSPRAVGGGAAASPRQPLSKRKGFLALATRQGWIGSCLSAAAALPVSCCAESPSAHPG